MSYWRQSKSGTKCVISFQFRTKNFWAAKNLQNKQNWEGSPYVGTLSKDIIIFRSDFNIPVSSIYGNKPSPRLDNVWQPTHKLPTQ